MMPGEFELVSLLAKHLSSRWSDGWPREMNCTVLDAAACRFSLSGVCPICAHNSVFLMIAGPAQLDLRNEAGRCCAAMQCQGCKEPILAFFKKSAYTVTWIYEKHYPLGPMNDRVAAEIPESIGRDYSEALRCRTVRAFNATVEMCRRAVQGACIDLKAPSADRLVEQIDYLARGGIITAPLTAMAHRIRLGGNLGAHPPEDPNDPDEIVIDEEYANAVLAFTRDFFQHVYVMPKKLEKYTFKKAPREGASEN